MRIATLPPIFLLPLQSIFLPICRAELQWPYNLPKHVKYFPDDEPLVKRDLEIREKLQQSKPNALKKMKDDAGEMFFLEYWGFEEEDHNEEQSNDRNGFNVSMISAPLRPHDAMSGLLPRWYQKRAFECPTGTDTCTNIGRPNSCCSQGLTCNIVPDDGLGDVGCCGSDGCGRGASSCPENYQSCPADNGGGCCIPGYTCEGVGCVRVSTTVVVVSPTPTSTSSPSSSSISSSTSSAPPSTSLEPTTTASTCSEGFRSCPTSLGGGCCPTDRECGSRTCPPSSTPSPTSPTQEPPVRPTSNEEPTVTSESPSPTQCPQNFYACAAYYPGAGCCQIDRDCASTSCPPRASSEIVVSNGVTVAAEPTTGICASEWSSCAATVGGGCCPSGYACGSESCSASSGLPTESPGSVAKQSSAFRYSYSWSSCIYGVVLSLGITLCF